MPSTYDIVLIPFPFTDLSHNKLRPAVLVANPYGNNIIVAFISSKQDTLRATDVSIPISSVNGLKKDSIIQCAKLATLDQGMAVGKIGELEPKYQKEIQGKLRTLFKL